MGNMSSQRPNVRNMRFIVPGIRFRVVRFIVPGMSFRVRVRGLVLGPMGPGASAPLGGPRAQT